jgi:hypothetical protein
MAVTSTHWKIRKHSGHRPAPSEEGIWIPASKVKRLAGETPPPSSPEHVHIHKTRLARAVQNSRLTSFKPQYREGIWIPKTAMAGCIPPCPPAARPHLNNFASGKAGDIPQKLRETFQKSLRSARYIKP